MRYHFYALYLLLIIFSVNRVSAQELDCDAMKDASKKADCKINLIRTQQSSLQAHNHHHYHHHMMKRRNDR